MVYPEKKQRYSYNESLSKARSFTFAIALFSHSSLRDDKPVSTESIVFISSNEQGPSTIRHSELFEPTGTTLPLSTHYCNPPLIFECKSAYGSFIFLSLHCLEKLSCYLGPRPLRLVL
ncbi:hypothetical protein T06_16032 [Trichinella sp. T6]|nr:hypothetical protein T06_16032 [Trichinella sp. T6]